MGFYKELKVLHKEKRISINEAARRGGISSAYLTYILQGKKYNVSQEAIEKIAKGYGVDPEYFSKYRLFKATEALKRDSNLVDEVLRKVGHAKYLKKSVEDIERRYYRKKQAMSTYKNTCSSVSDKHSNIYYRALYL